MSDLRTSGHLPVQPLTTTAPITTPIQKEISESPQDSQPVSKPEAFQDLKSSNHVATEQDLQSLQSSILEKSPSEILKTAKILPDILLHENLSSELAPKPSNEQLMQISKDTSQPLEVRLQALSQLDTTSDPHLRENSIKLFRNQNKAELQTIHAHFTGQMHHLQNEFQAHKSLLSKLPECQPSIEKINGYEQELSKLNLALGQAFARGEDLSALTDRIATLRQKINSVREELLVSLPANARSGQKFALESYLKLQDQIHQIQTQTQRLDLLLRSPAFPVSGMELLSRDPLPTSKTVQEAKDNAFYLELDQFQVKTPGDVSRLVAKITNHTKWNLDSNEGFEHFFHKVLGRDGLKVMPHALRGQLLAELYKAGVGHPDLVVHFIMNNARNLTDKPDRALLQRPEVKSTHIYQAAKMGVLNEALTRLKTTHTAVELISVLKNRTDLDVQILGNGTTQLDLTACKNLHEVLTDKHAGPNLLTSVDLRNTFLQSIKSEGLNTEILEGNDAQKMFNLLFKALVTGSDEGLKESAPKLHALLEEMKSQNISPAVPPLARLYFEIQAHPQKDTIIQDLKATPSLKFDAILDSRNLPDMAKVMLLDEALRLNRPELLKDQVELKALFEKLQAHPAQDLLCKALKNIPVNEHEIETRILERSEAVALKAYEPVLDMKMIEPEFGRFEDFHNNLKEKARPQGLNEGHHVKAFQEIQNRLSPAFFKQLDAVKNISDPLAQKEAAQELLKQLNLRRQEDRMENFFMEYILQDIADDCQQRNEVNQQFQELLSLDQPLTGSDLRNLSKLVGSNLAYYSQALAEMNPKAPKSLLQIFSEVQVRGGEMGITRLGETKPAPKFEVNQGLKDVLSQVKGASLEKGKVHEFFQAVQVQGGQPQNREWALNLEIIRHSLAQVPQDDRATRDQLTLRALSYLTRFASIPNPKDLGVQTTPLQKPLTDYHRANGNPLVKKYRETLAQHLGVHAENIQAVTDNRVLEVLKRDLRMTGHHQVVDAFDPKISSDDQGKLLKNLVKTVVSGDDKSSFFVDISPILAHNFKGGSQDENFVKDYIATSRQFVSDVISSTAEEVALDQYKQAHPEDQRDEKEIRKTVLESPDYLKMKQDLNERVVLGGTLNIGNQSVLYTAPLDTDFSSLQPEERKLSSDASTEFKNLVYHSGFTVGPQQMLENWIQLSDLDSIMGSMEISGAGIQFPDTSGKLEKISKFDDLLNHATFKSFENLKTENKPYLQILPSATASLLKGLNETDLQRVFQEKGLGDLYQLSANRILSSMEQITANKDHFNQVLDHIQLIHEEISTLLAIAQPHQLEDFNAMMRKNTDLMPSEFNPEIQPEFYLKNSGMRGLATVFTGVESLKGTGKLNIAVQNDTYYESAFVITGDKEHSTLGNREHTLFSLDGDKVDETAQSMKTKLNSEKLDLYLCEFHHNISYSKTSYHMENLTEQVDKLFAEEMVSDHFTVAIDNTIAKTDGQEFKDFLKHNEKRISEGKLNIVFYRSAQKFDMLGMDNFNGGVMSVINNGKDFKAFNTQMQSSEGREDHLSDMNIQGFSHFEKYAQKELNAYRSGIMKAASNMANPDSGSPLAFPKAMYHASGDDMSNPNALLKIAANTDPSAVFLDLSCPLYEVDSQGANDFLQQLQANLIRRNREKPEDFPLSNRASFGFPHSNISLIGGSKFRFNPGLESEETLKNFQAHFIKLNEMMLEAFHGAPNEQLRASAVKAVLTSTGDKLLKLRDQVKELEDKREPVSQELHLELATTYLNWQQPI
ncbi:hypothetical protein COW36_13315 [bacterium (Candidatus Blackallbacteria) CG17_big_fil_post_rev_8_21_14_2_50_48_46]|uniref:Uncharacterized protein n=1 Tax=bacterium (Candidatus Blackallbacteria) CG17_big_fil_post_rev_8_21_14_2_50_48_46 TaxID=2014261 RepID=A0A2M7G395_9BACT|nr:MAG: hypothetical protein COW64_21930 [bacterium (Candidatus Blackallbacteria) CG18_big_fil_WC_8_21_14_2_50_49_26]PIW16309.1 MAG: hypothetical protein COW36_13315 [bacterium (Candidatus Blackallbacteria) CG17_big_fil_post_rev_8_21_14_2_50_48_46]PIW45323.1 MAG: hypothetical protein COW20_20550 [bacterium (Candidatus Blackallbacteria) CG13_big_fil_rev_8_21_14_2_50_49_14]